ncbi:MAG: hypothetical protein KatS3mg057_1396 [Herpetosiphonaceae bacterium]|nr:MAG: hypothetical protein KatS3mg057_1396 [Herpetosiphonaceae bacterium]
MTLSPEDLRLRRRRLLRLMRLLFTLQLAFTVGLFNLALHAGTEQLHLAILLTGIGVAILLPRLAFRALGRLNWLYLPLLLVIDTAHVALLLWSRPAQELAQGSLWALAFIPLFLVAGRWWAHRGAAVMLAVVLLVDGLVLFTRLNLQQALPAFIFQAVLFALSAFITSLAEMRLRREMALREALLLSDERVLLANQLHEGICEQMERLETLLALAAAEQSDGSLQGRFAEAQALARNLLVSLQRSLRDVRPTPLGVRTLPEALARETEALSRELGIECRFRYAGYLPELRPAAAECLFRATQEALANVRSHAAARTVTVELDHDQHHVVLQVIDDGVGFDVNRALAGGNSANGLLGLRSYAEELGGGLRIDSRHGKGTRIEVRVPVARW